MQASSNPFLAHLVCLLLVTGESALAQPPGSPPASSSSAAQSSSAASVPAVAAPAAKPAAPAPTTAQILAKDTLRKAEDMGYEPYPGAGKHGITLYCKQEDRALGSLFPPKKQCYDAAGIQLLLDQKVNVVTGARVGN